MGARGGARAGRESSVGAAPSRLADQPATAIVGRGCAGGGGGGAGAPPLGNKREGRGSRDIDRKRNKR
jgi:hypothetical protein